MISHAGVAIFVFGNKLKNDALENSNGMLDEYEIAKSLGVVVIPIGATGYISQEIWQQEMALVQSNANYSDKFKSLFAELGNEKLSPDEISKIIVNILDSAEK